MSRARSFPEDTPFVCAGCGCLCDDIEIERSSSRAGAARFRNACPLGERWLLEERPERALAFLSGQESSIEEAVRRSSEILLAARAPAVAGLSGLSIEVAREAARIAENLRGILLPYPGEPEGSRRSGRFAPERSRTLGEARGRAALSIFWRGDPLLTHPRHLERFSLDPPLEDGGGRRAVLIGGPSAGETATARRANVVIALPSTETSGADVELARAIRGLLEGLPTGASGAAAKENAGPDSGDPGGAAAGALADLLQTAGGSHFYLGEEAARLPVLWDQLQLLAAKAPEPLRISVSLLAPAGNGRGAREVITWQTGVAGPVDFSSGAPRSLASPAPLEELIARGAIDALLAAGAGGDLDRAIGGAPSRITIGPRPDPKALVSFVVPGLDPRLRARVMRSDGAILRLCGRPAAGIEDPAVAILGSLADEISAVSRGGTRRGA